MKSRSEDEVEFDESVQIQFTGDLRINRMLNGMWQVSGANGLIDRRKAIQAMLGYHNAGFTTWDLADHYGPAEDFICEFRRQFKAVRGAGALADVQAFTKWVPQPTLMTRRVVEEASTYHCAGWIPNRSIFCNSIGGIMKMNNTRQPWRTWLNCSSWEKSSIWP